MRVFKQVIGNSMVQFILGALLYVYLRIVYKTCRWHIIGAERHHQTIAHDGKVIVAFWHGRLGVILRTWPHRINGKLYRLYALVSAHRDGEFLTKVLQLFRYKLIRGSSGKQEGIKAYYHAVRTLQQGDSLGITPDGPRGPRMRVHGLLAKIAHKTHVGVIPTTASIRHGIVFNSWDKFILPLPFSRGVIIYDEIMYIEEDADDAMLEQFNNSVEEALNRISAEADRRVGRDVVQPADK